jgi:hypothetical protein
MSSQSPSPSSPYPSNDAPLALHSGTIVRVRNLVVFQSRAGDRKSLTITIQTPTSAADRTRLAQEALEIATLHNQFADAHDIYRVTVAVCRTRTCLELREVASEMLHFVRGANGAWTPEA